MVAACADEVASKKASKDFSRAFSSVCFHPLSSQCRLAMIVRYRVNGIFLWGHINFGINLTTVRGGLSSSARSFWHGRTSNSRRRTRNSLSFGTTGSRRTRRWNTGGSCWRRRTRNSPNQKPSQMRSLKLSGLAKKYWRRRKLSSPNCKSRVA
jgi:hypothetical protein